MKQKLLLFAAAFLTFAFSVKAQSPIKVSGNVNDATGKPLKSASVLLYRAKDSGLAKTAITDDKGAYNMPVSKPGNYFIKASGIGYQSTSSAVFEVKEGDNITIPSLSLKIADKNLEGVTVTAKKPIVEVKADKMIVNVEGTINAVGNDGLELLRKSPGVMLDKDDNISLAGKHVVVVGRSNLVGKPITNLLYQKTPYANAVVTICHTGTDDIRKFTRQADVLVAAIGVPNRITADDVKDGVIVIDVGINKIADPTTKSGSRLVGDVDYASVFPKSQAITPVPKGVGPMTIAMLLDNTYRSAAGEIFV